MQNSQALAHYLRTGTSQAFGELAGEYVDLVYSACLRQVRDEHLAEDVAQAVLVILFRKVGGLPADTVLSAWLLGVCRLACRDVLRREAARKQREQKAATMKPEVIVTEESADWGQVAPYLDDALASLGRMDRSAVALRFFEQRSLREVGQMLGLSEDAAQKRIGRALEKLRKLMGRKTAVPSVAGLAVAMAANVVQAAPVGVVQSISAIAISGGSGTSSVLARGVINTMWRIKMKVAAVIAVIIMAVIGTGVSVAQHSTTQPVAGAQNVVPEQVDATQILRRAAEALTWTERCATVTKVKLSSVLEGGSPLRSWSSDSITIRKYQASDGRVHVKLDQSEYYLNKKVVKAPIHSEYILTNGQHIYFNSFSEDPGKGVVQIASEKQRIERWKKSDRCNSRLSAFMDGFVDNDETSGLSIIDLAIKGTITPRVTTENWGNIRCYVVEAQTAIGQLRVWVAPSKGNNIAKYVLESKPSSKKTLRILRASFEATSFREIASRTVIEGGRYDCKTLDDNDSVWNLSSEAHRLEINLDPRFDEPGLFTSSAIPNGLRVVLDDTPDVDIEFVWQDGKPVPKVDTNR